MSAEREMVSWSGTRHVAIWTTYRGGSYWAANCNASIVLAAADQPDGKYPRKQKRPCRRCFGDPS